MSDTLQADGLKDILREISRLMNEQKDELCRLDGLMGDGDIGLTMARGFSAIVESLDSLPADDLGLLLMRAGALFNEKASSSMGTLISTALMYGGKAVKGKSELAAADLADLANGMVEGIKHRGKSDVGQKTILDSMAPAAATLKQAAAEGLSIAEALAQAAKTAKEGREQATDMKAQHGRAARYGDKSIGVPDPGAAVGALIFQGFAQSVAV